MKNPRAKILLVLHGVYDKHRRRHRENPDSNQMCCMWSTSNPPDDIQGTMPLCDIERALDITIDEDIAVTIYDMTLDQAADILANIAN